MTPGGRRFLALLGLLVGVALLVRVDALRNTAPDVPAFSDAEAYHLLAANLAGGEGFVRPYDLERFDRRVPTAEYPPGLPLLLAGADLFGIDGVDAQRGILVVVGAATVALVGLAGRRLGGDGAGLLAAAVAALHPALWSADTTLMAESLAACLGAAAVLAALAVRDRPDLRRAAVLGAVLGAGVLVRAEFALLAVLLVPPLAWRAAPDARGRLRLGGAALAAFAALLVPWTVRNWLTFHDLVPVSNNSGSVARGANCDLAYRGEFRGLWVTNVADVGGDDVDPAGRCFRGFPIRPGVDEAEAAAELRADGLAYVRDNLGELPGVVGARLGRTVGLYRFDQQTAFAGLEGRSVTWERRGTRAFQVLAVVGLLGAVAPWRRARRWILLAPGVAAAVTVALTYGNPRFRAVAEPAVVLLAALAVAELAGRLGAYFQQGSSSGVRGTGPAGGAGSSR